MPFPISAHPIVETDLVVHEMVRGAKNVAKASASLDLREQNGWISRHPGPQCLTAFRDQSTVAVVDYESFLHLAS